MKLATFFWKPETGWSVDRFPASDSDRTWILLFGSSGLIDDPTPIEELKRAYPNAHLTGCSSAGEIFGPYLLEDSLAVAAIEFEHTRLEIACRPVKNSDTVSRLPSPEASYQAGRAIATHLCHPDLQGILILADGLRVNASELLRGINTIVYRDIRSSGNVTIPVVGGLAADCHQFRRTWTIAGGIPQSGWATGIGFYGDRVRLGFGCQGGWAGFGPQRTVTRSWHNLLYELDGKPVLQLYQEYLGKLAWELPATALLLPLAVGSPASRDQTVRTAVAVDRASRSMTFTGNIPEGSVARLMRGNAQRLIDGAIASALIACNNSRRKMGLWEARPDRSQKIQPDRPTLAIAIGGSGRRLVLGERTEEELEATLDELPDKTQQIGFYGYGEFAPYGVAAVCQLQNQTMTSIAIQEASG